MGTGYSTHCVMGRDSIRCLNCGEEYPVNMPCSVDMFSAIAKSFDKEHRRCKSSDRGRARFIFGTPEEWAESWDTGVSSATIWSVMTERPTFHGGYGIPLDPSDFGRCYRLLKAFPDWKLRLHEVSQRHPAWAPLIACWNEMERLYEEELPSGHAPKLNALMKSVLP